MGQRLGASPVPGGSPLPPGSPGHALRAGHPAAGSCEAARGGCQCAARGFSERLGGRREASPPLCVAPPAPPPPRAGALRGCAGLWGLWGLQEQEQEQEQRQEQEQPRSVRPRGGGAGVRGGQEGAGEGGAGPGGTHRELEVLGQQVLELGDALVDAVAPLLLDEPVGQLVGLLRGAVPGERSARPPRGARRAPGTGGGGLCARPSPPPQVPESRRDGAGGSPGVPRALPWCPRCASAPSWACTLGTCARSPACTGETKAARLPPGAAAGGSGRGGGSSPSLLSSPSPSPPPPPEPAALTPARRRSPGRAACPGRRAGAARWGCAPSCAVRSRAGVKGRGGGGKGGARKRASGRAELRPGCSCRVRAG